MVGVNGRLGGKSADVRLLVSELVANAVVHAGVGDESFLRFVLSAASDRVKCILEYPGEPFDAVPQLHQRHFGLYLVDSLSDSWGVARDGDKSVVWFEIGQQ